MIALEQDLVAPTLAHQAVAELAEAGLVRVLNVYPFEEIQLTQEAEEDLRGM